jgi:hypothetical protein
MTTETPDDIEIVHEDDAGLAPEGQQAAPAAPVITPEEGISDLKRQLDEATARAANAEAAAQAASTESARFRTEADQARYTAISRAMETATSEVERQEAAWATAMESGDYKAAAKAQTAQAKAAQQLNQLEAGKQQMEAMRADPRYQQPAQPRHDPNSFEGRIAAMSPRTQQWLRAHPDAVSNPMKNAEVVLAHQKAVAAGHAPDSDAYFHFVEQEAGYRAPVAQPAPRVANPSAPASQQARAPAGPQINGNRIVMTPKMREAARTAGVTEKEYAREYLKAVKNGDIEPLH